MVDFNVIGKGVVQVGKCTHIDPKAQVVFSKPGKVVVGDYCVIGPGVKIICAGGDVEIGDWSTLHDNCLVLSGQYVSIGAHCWFGQNSIIDGSGGLSVGRGVRVGMYSQIWSHVAAGEQIEGCTLIGERPVVIEDDVWLVGSCIVASGVTIGRQTVALIGSNITKSFESHAVIAGAPAAKKEKIKFYKELSADEKWQMLEEWLQAAKSELDLELTSELKAQIELRDQDGARVIFVQNRSQVNDVQRDPRTTICCLEDKTYNKAYTSVEKKVLKYLAGNKARFYTRADVA